jgi:hypothetical protein
MIDEVNIFLLIPRALTPIFSQLTRTASENPVEAKSKFPVGDKVDSGTGLRSSLV